MKPNCWQFRRCGREPGGKYVHESGVCPASVENKLHGIHNGHNGGRACWAVPGTPCSPCEEGLEEDFFARKYKQCSACDFYKKVRSEENRNFLLSVELQKILGRPGQPE